MKNYIKEIVLGLFLLIIFAGLLIWGVFSTPQKSLIIVIAIIIVLVALVTFVAQVLKKKRDLEAGAPAEDEFTRLVRVYAGSRAFTYSMYLWMLIFIFNSVFTKPQTMLGIGILGSALIYGLWLLYFKFTGELYEE
jgi:hypothetical protein